MNWDTGEYLSLGTQALGHLFSALGARGQAKTAKLNAQLQYQADKYNSERQYQIDLFTGRRTHRLGQYEAESLSMQGRIKQAQLRQLCPPRQNGGTGSRRPRHCPLQPASG